MRKPEGVCLRSLRLVAAAAAALAHLASPWASSLRVPPAHAVDAVNVRTDAAAIDLTDALDRQRTETDRIQVSTAPGPDGIIRRIEVRGREVEHQLGGVRAVQFRRRTDRPADRDPALPDGRLRTVLARSRIVARRCRSRRVRANVPNGRIRRLRIFSASRSIPARSSPYVVELAHRQTAAALSVGAGRLQGQDQFLHALLRHRHRHRRIAGAVPDHPVRRQGQRDVSGRRRARLGGAGLYRHRLSDSGARCSTCRRAPNASGARSAKPFLRQRCSCSCSPISISAAGMCATPTSPSPGSAVSRR